MELRAQEDLIKMNEWKAVLLEFRGDFSHGFDEEVVQGTIHYLMDVSVEPFCRADPLNCFRSSRGGLTRFDEELLIPHSFVCVWGCTFRSKRRIQLKCLLGLDQLRTSQITLNSSSTAGTSSLIDRTLSLNSALRLEFERDSLFFLNSRCSV